MNDIDTTAAIRLLEEISLHGACRKRKVGAFLLQSSRVVLKASNGMPKGSLQSCLNGGCIRCANGSSYDHGIGYDLCFCLHAEERIIAMAARLGVSVGDSLLFCSYQPCIMCLKMIIEAGIKGVRYIQEWEVPETASGLVGLKEEYDAMSKVLPGSSLCIGELNVKTHLIGA